MGLLPRRVGTALIAATCMVVVITSWQGESTARPGHWAESTLAALVIVAGFALVRLLRPPSTWLAVVALGLGSVVAALEGHAAAATIGIYATVIVAASAPGRLGIALGAVAAVVYVVASAPGAPVAGLLAQLAGLGFAGLAAATVQRRRTELVERARAEERAGLAREVHDVLSHTLTALSVQLEAARLLAEQRPGEAETLAALERAQALTRQGLEETRQAVGALRGDAPSSESLRGLVTAFNDAGGRATADVGEVGRLSAAARVALYRTVQEALTNVRKHAPGARVTVSIRAEGAGTELVVDDVAGEGSGRRRELAGTGGGHGLQGIRERAELLGGRLDAGPTSEGFRVSLWLPAS